MLALQPKSFFMNVSTDRQSFPRNNVSARLETLNKPPVARGDTTEMRGRHPFTASSLESDETLNCSEQIVHHSEYDARKRVHVNNDARVIVRASKSKGSYKCAMTVQPIDRIAAAILLSGRSLRDISKSSGQGVNFVSQMLNSGKISKNEGVSAISQELGIDASWTFTGHPSNPRLDRLIELFTHLDFEQKKNAFRTLSAGKSQTIENLQRLAETSNVPLSDIQAWLEGAQIPSLQGDAAIAFEEINNIASGQEIDLPLLLESVHEAYEVIREILGHLGPTNKRAILIRDIYREKLAEREKLHKP